MIYNRIQDILIYPERTKKDYLLLVSSELACQNQAVNPYAYVMDRIPSGTKYNRCRTLYSIVRNKYQHKAHYVSDRVSFNSRLN